MELHIKNMVCARCLKTVKNVFEALNIGIDDIRLGIVNTSSNVSEEDYASLKFKLEQEGFYLLEEQKVKLVQQVKQEIIDLVHYSDLDEMKQNLSDILSSKLHRDYHYLSNLFSSVENTTIEQYFILQKIERVKEWLVYGEMTLSEMAFKLSYSSVAHLSNQFKKITGFTPSQFKQLKDHHRKPLDSL